MASKLTKEDEKQTGNGIGKRYPVYCMRVTSPLWYAVFSFLHGTQYAKGRYAVRINSVISYADINVYFKMVQCSSRNTTQVTDKVK